MVCGSLILSPMLAETWWSIVNICEVSQCCRQEDSAAVLPAQALCSYRSCHTDVLTQLMSWRSAKYIIAQLRWDVIEWLCAYHGLDIQREQDGVNGCLSEKNKVRVGKMTERTRVRQNPRWFAGFEAESRNCGGAHSQASLRLHHATPRLAEPPSD